MWWCHVCARTNHAAGDRSSNIPLLSVWGSQTSKNGCLNCSFAPARGFLLRSDPSSIIHPRVQGGDQLTFEGVALFISQCVNVREQSSLALRGNRNQRGHRPHRINHLPFLYCIREDAIPQTYTDSSPRNLLQLEEMFFFSLFKITFSSKRK